MALIQEADFINFRLILDSVIHINLSTEDWFSKTALRLIDIQSSKKLPHCSGTKPRLFSAMILPQMSEHVPLAIVATPT